MKNKQQTDERKNTPSTPVTEKQNMKKNTEKKSIFGNLRTKKTPTADDVNITRFNADANEGLSKVQVAERTEKGLVNKTGKKYSKTYKSIFIGNICTFFNLLCLLAGIALLIAHAPLAQFSFVLSFGINIVVSIVQEIRAKRKIDKLSILSSPTAKVVRGGERLDIPVEEIVLDDIIILSAGQQVPADCIAVEGTAERNDSLLSGESVPIK